MKKKGFTLIELLAVIVILAVIALIAVPTILNVIEKSRKGAAEQSALGYIDAIEKQVAINELDETKTNISDGTYDVPLDDTYGVTIKGEAPKEGWVEITKGIVTKYSLTVGKYIVSFDGTNKKVEKGENALEKPEGNLTTGGPTSETPSGIQYTGVKKIVYLDPTDLTKTCTSSNINSDTETKTGCMKWYAYEEDATTYTMILDHNTTALVAWNSSNDNSSMGEVKTQLENDTIGWDNSLNSRLIMANEVATIVGNTDWDSSIATTSDYFYFKDLSQNDATGNGSVCANDGCKYAWLYDRTRNDCIKNGCLNNSIGTNIYGYWTSSSVAGNENNAFHRAWHVNYYGGLHFSYYVDNPSFYGVRPVITVLKSQIS